MSIDALSGLGGLAVGLDRETFGAEVVSKTLDVMNGTTGQGSPAPVDKETFGAAVVGKTLDVMNAGGAGQAGMSQTYEFAKDVLSGLTNTGIVTDVDI